MHKDLFIAVGKKSMPCNVCNRPIKRGYNVIGQNKRLCIKCAGKIDTYKFVDFSPKVISKNADESSVRCEGQQLTHNED